jgi:hypothetical protein
MGETNLIGKLLARPGRHRHEMLILKCKLGK